MFCIFIMSSKTLFNEDLVLNSLTVNNSRESNQAGYVPSSTTFSSSSTTSSVVNTSDLVLYASEQPNVSVSNASGRLYTAQPCFFPNTISNTTSVSTPELILTEGTAYAPIQLVNGTITTQAGVQIGGLATVNADFSGSVSFTATGYNPVSLQNQTGRVYSPSPIDSSAGLYSPNLFIQNSALTGQLSMSTSGSLIYTSPAGTATVIVAGP